ncbi:MAG: hypothetical protein A3B74_02220 [Candidatus Kerfeldbacteria bacterium RIFCSPHIGHO2_02_FULL_42_14]|uniref:Uncharacterized protein n=1 Tax=Candidatus Kerfeldbacteria bacterium RIFCSPHIGHO2_02_FULL_42_14 TaxID=1798540 RepID=A0A1G2ARN2_9BACT|nr:MAG: hypothetical protein A3B74_02220 [Candidatus Kerfeldbacteria bacterium RIFCSPHIGHO2_02_FULL_42_14]OGY80365.1 MAG: hypothetical protein A3E60_04840 [Candidatus Kerfeldbacteria bacterium RIFCSPHIGHO2_12_FULL_42_13]OGY83794.1 MAG: hypothetical protein A3I91_04365 [Candidatus Kerfeldbacteria bacterium RIFCSPLOWO2_02_FULL_42_19]OGY87139.1 MAG: hypothetical protein A3G01_04645 [Candidatus Kerfeldbacteria bacterium RIFCSPLOWO2_12_FULL_43_9]
MHTHTSAKKIHFKNLRANMARNFFGAFAVIAGIGFALIVQAITINGSSQLGAGSADTLMFESSTLFTGVTHQFPSITIGKQGVGGVTFFNGTIVNSTVKDDGSDNPVTFGDNIRVDGRIFRGAKQGPETDGVNPILVDDNFETSGNTRMKGTLTVNGASTLTGDVTIGGNETISKNATIEGSAIVRGNQTIVGTLTVGEAALTAATLANTDVVETITADWVNTANPWSASEIADVTRTVQLLLTSFYNVDATNSGAIVPTSASTQPAFIVSTEGNVFLRWTNADTDPAGIAFIVPNDYTSGGTVKITTQVASGTTGDNDILGKIWKVSDNQSASTKTFTNLTGGTNFDSGITGGNIKVVSLTLPDTLTLAAGDHVSFSIERSSGSDSIDVHSIALEYTAKQ